MNRDHESKKGTSDRSSEQNCAKVGDATGPVQYWRPSMARRKKFTAPAPGDQTCTEKVRTLQDHQRDLPCGVPAPASSDVFHASLLSPYSETPSHGPNFSRPPPDLIGGEEEYEVESIRSHRYFGRNKKLQFLIRWKGYAPSDDTWEPADSVHAPDLVKEYKQRTPGFRINSNPNSSSRSIILSPLWQTSQPGSLEPDPHRSQHLVPSSFTMSTQSTSTHRPLPTDPTSFLALHYAPVPRVHSRESYSPHLHSRPPTHILLRRGQEGYPLPVSQSHLCLRLTPCPPPPGLSPPPMSHPPKRHLPSLYRPDTPLQTTPSHPDQPLTFWTAALTSTPIPCRVSPKLCLRQSNKERPTTSPRSENSTPELPDSKTLSKPTPKPLNAAQRDTSSTPNTLGSPLTSATVYSGKSSGSSSWSKVLWPASPKTTVRATLLTSLKSMPSPVLRQSRSNLSPYGWRASSWGHQPPSTLLLKPQGSLMTGVSMLTCSGLGSSTHLGKRRKGRNANGRHVQMLLHLPRTCARVVWKQPTARTSSVHSKTWARSAAEHSSLAEAAAPTLWCVDATM